MKFHLLHVRIARSYGFPRYVILASFHSIRTDFVSLVIFISQRNLVSFRQFYTKSKDRSTGAVTRAQNTLQRVILFRNLHRRNYFSRAIRREKNKEKKLKIDHRSLRLRERLTEFSTRHFSNFTLEGSRDKQAKTRLQLRPRKRCSNVRHWSFRTRRFVEARSTPLANVASFRLPSSSYSRS